MEKLTSRIDQTREIINTSIYPNKFVSDDTYIILQNQLIIMESLEVLLKSNNSRSTYTLQ